MLSNILNIFRKVDSERLACAQILRNNKYHVTDKVSYSEITNIIKNNIKEGPDSSPTYTPLEPPYYKGPVYYNNPLDDPEVWKVPTDWPDVETILNNTPAQTYITTSNNKDTEYTAIPSCICLFEVTDPSITGFTIASVASMPTVTENTAPILHVYKYNSNVTYAYYLPFIATSDGKLYDTTKVTSYEHTWDTSKDIIVGDKRYRYCILYGSNTTSSFGYIRATNCGIRLLQIVAYMQVGATSIAETGSSIGVTGSTKNELLHYKVIDFRNNISATLGVISESRLNICRNFSCRPASSLKFFEVVMSDEYNPTQSSTSQYPFYSLYTEELNRVEINAPAIFNAIPNAYLNIGPNTIYMKTPAASIRRAHQYSYNGNATTDTTYYRFKLKYYEIVGTTAPEYSCIAYAADNSFYEPNSGNYYLKLPDLINIEPYLCASSITGSLRFFGTKFINSTLKFRATNVDLAYIKDFICDTVELVNCKTIRTSDPGKFYINKLILDKVTTITNPGTSYTFGNISEIYAPALTTLDASNNSSFYYFGGFNTVLYLPSLSTIPSATVFESCNALHTLTVGQNFKAKSISLKNCYSLTFESLIDFFNKLAVLTDAEIAQGYSITLPVAGVLDKDLLPEEIKSIATSKGWVLK